MDKSAEAVSAANVRRVARWSQDRAWQDGWALIEREGFQYSGFGSGARLSAVGEDLRMLLRFVYFAFCATLRLLVRRGEAVRREAEVIVLRHEVAVLRRTAGRPRMDWADRALFAALVGVLRPDRRAGRIVSPATLVRWPRDLARRRWPTRSADQAGHRSTR